MINRWALRIAMKAIVTHRNCSKKLPTNPSKRWVSLEHDDEKYLDITQKLLERRYNQQ